MNLSLGKQIAVRGIPSDIFEALVAMAKLNDRAVEAEARAAIRAWTAPLLIKAARSTRRQEVASRLGHVLSEVSKVRQGRFCASHLAQGIGEEHVEMVEQWLLGEVEPSFAQLGSMATFLGSVPEWLQHGDLTPFPVDSVHFRSNESQTLRWMLNLPDHPDYPICQHNPGPLKGKLQRLIFVRANDEAGKLVIVKEMDDRRCVVYRTGIHVSGVNGAGGENRLMDLFVALELLYKVFTTADTTIQSWLVSPETYNSLTAGQVHPLSMEPQADTVPWWEDVWHNKMSQQHNYWPEWKFITERLQKLITQDSRLSQKVASIRNDTHPFIEEWRLRVA